MTRDGLPSGLPFASAGEPRVHMPAPQPSPASPISPVPATDSAVPNAAPSAAQSQTVAPRSLADFALLGQGAPLPAEDASARADATQGPVLRILYNASTRGTLHPCPS